MQIGIVITGIIDQKQFNTYIVMYFLILQYNLTVLEQPDIHAENINSLFFFKTFIPVSAMNVQMELANSLVFSFNLLLGTVRGGKNLFQEMINNKNVSLIYWKPNFYHSVPKRNSYKYIPSLLHWLSPVISHKRMCDHNQNRKFCCEMTTLEQYTGVQGMV